jgi:acyl-CoA synthetase (AMP-forming)/AMP-acid ligase II
MDGDSAIEQCRNAVAILTAPGGLFEIADPDDPARRLYAGTPRNLNRFLETARQAWCDLPFLELGGERFTFGEVFDQADRLAAGLHARHNLGKGDVVGIAMRNCLEWFVGFFAILRIGAVASLLNSRGTADEIADAATRSDCRLVLADDRRAEQLEGLAGCPVLDHAALHRLAGDEPRPDLPVMPDPEPDDPALIQFTSGTTGRPKGATMTHRNMCHVAREGEFRRDLALTIAATQNGRPFEVLQKAAASPASLLVFPMFHISGITMVLMALSSGGLMAVMHKWNPAEALDIIEANRVGALSGPSLIFSDLLALPNAAERLRSVRSFAVGGQATPDSLARRLTSTVSGSGMAGGWGQTECSGPVTFGTAAIYGAFPGTVGMTSTLAEIRVVDEQGRVLPAGEIGEFEVRGPMVMKGYWNDPQATASAFRDGWLRTGDIGHFDEYGMVYIADRAKDMVISGAENIYCAEVERVLSMLDGQGEVALFGVPDERLGERAVAAVVWREDAGATAGQDEILAHVRTHLAAYKVPSEVRFDLGPLPRNALGKIDKAALLKRYTQISGGPA